VTFIPGDQASRGTTLPCQVFGSADLAVSLETPWPLCPLPTALRLRETGFRQQPSRRHAGWPSRALIGSLVQEPTTHSATLSSRGTAHAGAKLVETPEFRRTSTKHLSSTHSSSVPLRLHVVLI
jgi:hypothetical protein